ncbi:MAG: mercury methylation ferredoxin HgcB [Candidatus Zixiibacteriota bacterium]
MVGLRYLSNVVSLELDRSKCNGCRKCVEVCPHAVYVIEEKRAIIVDRDACMECGACAQNCEPGAITVRSGVGCAAAFIYSALTGTEPCCGDSGSPTCCG